MLRRKTVGFNDIDLAKDYLNYAFLENIQKVVLSDKEIWKANIELFIRYLLPGTISKLSDYVLFNQKYLSIYSSALTIDEFKLLFKKNEITDLSITCLKILDDQSIQLSKEESFKLILKSLSKSERVGFSYHFDEVPPNCLELLDESGCKFKAIDIKMPVVQVPFSFDPVIDIINSTMKHERNELILMDFEFLHKFLAQKERCWLTFYVGHFDPEEDYDPTFSNYFKKVDDENRYLSESLLIFKLNYAREIYYVSIKVFI